MNFKNAQLVETTVWNMRLADLSRAQNRAAIDRLFNGFPPLTEAERIDSGAHTNVNFLDAPKIAADARRTYSQAFLKGANLFNVTLDGAPPQYGATWGRAITRSINRILKKSKTYFEVLRSQFAQVVMHGIGPVWWPDQDRWCPRAIGVGDIMIPSGTLLTMENAVYFAVFRQWTALDLKRAISGSNVDPGWNKAQVEKCIEWVDVQIKNGMYASQFINDWMHPERVEQRWVEDGAFYGTDAVPTVDAWDFYWKCDDDDSVGWRRGIILDTSVGAASGQSQPQMPDRTTIGQEHGNWLYYREGVYADTMDQIVHFQFGDAAAVGPFRYHTVRSLGWLLYSVCHLQNRLRCKLNDHTFENLLQYFRASNPEDHERILKVDLHNYGIVPEGISFVTPQERWQVNAPLVELGMSLNRQSMNEAAAQYREGREGGAAVEKTATQVIAEVNSANALVSGMLLQAYQYASYQYREIARRFTKKNSSDPDVRAWRAEILKSGVPEEWIDCERWNVEPEQVMGAGNKILQVAMADKLMGARNLYSPQAQTDILRLYTEVNADDPELARQLVPLDAEVNSPTAHDADQSAASLLAGINVRSRPGENAIEIAEAWLSAMAQRIQVVQVAGPDAEDLLGLQNLGNHIAQKIQVVASDPNEKPRVKQYTEDLRALMQVVQELATLVPGQQPPPNDAEAKVEAMRIQAAAKARISEATAAQKLQHKDDAFRLKLIQQQESHEADLQRRLQEDAVSMASADLKTAAELRREGVKSASETAASE